MLVWSMMFKLFSRFFLFFTSIIVIYYIYTLGLPGSFLLDDFYLLSKLNVHDLKSFFDFIMLYEQGIRFVSMASFLINDFAWPSDPFVFKYTNILLHLLNGVLVFWLIYRLSDFWIAFLVMLFWLIHPLQISTVLYVIQRMVELSVLFTLITLISYTYIRTWRIKSILVFSIIFFGLLAVFSKEIGVLLLLYILLLERFFLYKFAKPKHFKLWFFIFIYLPLIIVIGYLVFSFPGFLNGYQLRDFNLLEKLLTESVVLLDYLRKIFIPPMTGFGLLQDDFPLSHGLFKPVYTFIAVVTLVFLLLSALFLRKKYPVYAFAILWFFAGHLLESTFIPLEIYFEHRNYLPMLGPLFALVFIFMRYQGKIAIVLKLILLMLLSLNFFITVKNLPNWQNQEKLFITWAKEHPNSARAQHNLAVYASLKGNLIVSEYYLQNAVKIKPKDSGYFMQLLQTKCVNKHLSNVTDWKKAFKTLEYAHLYIDALQDLLFTIEVESCKQFSINDFRQAIGYLIKNPNFKTEQENLYYVLGKTLLIQGDLIKARQAFDSSYLENKNTQALVWAAYAFYSHQYNQTALLYANKALQQAIENKETVFIEDLQIFIKDIQK